MLLKDYFQIIKPQYVFLKLTPTNSIRNYNSDKIAKAMHQLYKTLKQRIRKQEKQFFIEAPSKVAYYIYIEKNKVDFYFIVPKYYVNLVREKASDTWKQITIKEVDKIPLFSDNALKYSLYYKKEDPLSLAVDKRTNTLLSSTLNVIDIMEEGDKVGIFYNFIPTTQFTWRSTYKNTMKKLDENLPIDKEKINLAYAGKLMLVLLLNITNMITEAFAEIGGGKKSLQDTNVLELAFKKMNRRELSSATKNKSEKIIIDTQMLIISESSDKTREKNNAISVCESYKSISEDNELTYKKVKTKEINLMNVRINGVEVNKVSVDECQNFISLPGRELLENYNFIDKIDTFQSEVPLELREGVMCVGENLYKGATTKAYLTEDKEFKFLTLVLIGPTRAGKTNLIANLSKYGLDYNETTILFDFCGNCELSNEVASVIDKNRVLIIDCGDFNKIQGLGYNEVTPNNSSTFEVYRCAKTKTNQLMTFVNSIAGEELRDRMERYLEAAALTVFVQEGPIKDIFSVLQDHVVRMKYINNIPKNQEDNLGEYVSALQELDEVTKVKEEIEVDGKKVKTEKLIITGTRTAAVQGILNRISKLKQNPYMEIMLKKNCSNNVNLIEEMQKAQLICIKMPETMFATETEKDIYSTYWLTKIWGALQKRKWDLPKAEDRVKVNMVIDELYQVPSCQEFLRSKLSQIAKFSCKPILSCHYLGQIGIIRDELKAANSSYMLIAGCDKDNFKELKSELYPFTEEDLLSLKRFESLNLIKYEKGFARFITKLPTDIILP